MEEEEDGSESVTDVRDAPVSEDDLPPEMQIIEELGDTDEVHDESKSDSTRVGKESFSTRSIGITVSPSETDWSMDLSFSFGKKSFVFFLNFAQSLSFFGMRNVHAMAPLA